MLWGQSAKGGLEGVKKPGWGRADRLRLIEVAREAGFSDSDILREVLRGEYGWTHRRELAVEWGQLLGLDASDALRLAHEAGLIPSAHPPRKGRG